ncbi:9986_t:CDS:2, partial [Paraglomus occultum]
NVIANSATFSIPSGKIWWVWSATPSNIFTCNAIYSNSTTFNSTCGSALNLVPSATGYSAFKFFMWSFNSKTTPVLDPNTFKTVNSISSCSDLPCGCGPAAASFNQYYVLAIQNNNAFSVDLQLDVSWDMDCGQSNTGNSTTSGSGDPTSPTNSNPTSPSTSSSGNPSSTNGSSGNPSSTNGSSVNSNSSGITYLISLVTMVVFLWN